MSRAGSHYSSRFIDFIDNTSLNLPSLEGLQGRLVPSIEEAIKPLQTVLKDVDKMLQQVVAHSLLASMEKPAFDEAAAILLYSFEWCPREQSIYHVLNRTLASKERNEKLKPWLLFLRLLLVGLSKRPLVQNTKVYRGIPHLVDYSGRQEVIWWPFTSCSSDEKSAMAFVSERSKGTLFIIDIRSGTEIGDFSLFPGEKEILLTPNRHFDIEKRVKTEEGLTIVHLKETEASDDSAVPKILNCSDKKLTDENLQPVIDEAITQKCTDLLLAKNSLTGRAVQQLIRCLAESKVRQRYLLSVSLSSSVFILDTGSYRSFVQSLG